MGGFNKPRYKFLNALEYASEEMKDNVEIVMAAVKTESFALQYASSNMKNNIDIVMEAVKQWPSSLQFASPHLQNNFQVVMEAVKGSPEVLGLASSEMQHNEDIVMAAVLKCETAFRYVPYKFREDSQFALKLLSQLNYSFKEYFQCFASKVRNDRNVIETLIQKNPEAIGYGYAGDKLRKDFEFNLQMVAKNGLALQYVRKDMKNKKDLVKAAISQNKESFKYASENLKQDPELIAMCYN